MRSHFLPQKLTAACAMAGATTLLAGAASAQSFIAADSATNSTYASGWAAGQNGGYGFGPWSFDGTTDPRTGTGPQQEISTAAPIGTAWTLFNLGSAPGGAGISDVGRTIPGAGGLQPGQTFETVIDNPTAYHYYGGFDILFCNGNDNNPAGDNAAALRMTIFFYGGFGDNVDWVVTDGSPYSTTTSLLVTDTAAAGMKFDLTLLTTNSYSLTMTPLGNPSNVYTQTGTLALISTNSNTSLGVTELPITWVNYRLWNGKSGGSNDLTENFEISNMSVRGLNLNIQQAGTNAVLSWQNFPGFYLESASGLAPANWHSNSISPVTINGENFVTNPITGHQQFFRLQLQQ